MPYTTLLLLILSTLIGCASTHSTDQDQLVGRPPIEQPDPGPKRDTVVLVVYDISEEDQALLDEEERAAIAEARANGEEEPETSTTTTTVEEEENTQITTQQTGAGIPWSGGPIPDGYEGPVSNP
jgi:hypothetical protein